MTVGRRNSVDAALDDFDLIQRALQRAIDKLGMVSAKIPSLFNEIEQVKGDLEEMAYNPFEEGTVAYLRNKVRKGEY